MYPPQFTPSAADEGDRELEPGTPTGIGGLIIAEAQIRRVCALQVPCIHATVPPNTKVI